ncbi:MAG: hypothetical protein ABEJ26_13195 [Halosimplex sp.]
MQRNDEAETGWTFVAEHDAAARLFDAALDLDADETYTRDQLAEASGVALKTLYLNDLVGEFVEIGVFAAVDATEDGEQDRYRLDEDSDLLAAARAFDETFDAAE